MQYGRRSGILFSSFVIYERERFCFFAAQGAAGDRRRSAAFFLRARWGEGREAFHAPGRKLRFLRFPVLTQSYAALPARPRFARTLRGHCAPDGAWAWVTSGALPRENHGDRRDKAAQIFRARQGVKAKAYWRYVEPKSTTHCAKRQAERAWRLPRFRQGRAPNVTPNPRAAAHKRSAQCTRGMERNPAFLIYWNYNDGRAGLPTHEKICET